MLRKIARRVSCAKCSDGLFKILKNVNDAHMLTLFPHLLDEGASSLHPSALLLLARSSCSQRSLGFLYDELLGGFSIWQEALSLI